MSHIQLSFCQLAKKKSLYKLLKIRIMLLSIQDTTQGIYLISVTFQPWLGIFFTTILATEQQTPALIEYSFQQNLNLNLVLFDFIQVCTFSAPIPGFIILSQLWEMGAVVDQLLHFSIEEIKEIINFAARVLKSSSLNSLLFSSDVNFKSIMGLDWLFTCLLKYSK